MPVGIDPTDANKIYIGGAADGASTRIFARATDGSTFASSAGGLHADAHAIAVAPSNTAIVYFGNDGGIYKSTDSGATWASLNNTGFSATQFMGLATHPTDREFMIGGTQDNGTNFKKPDGTWTRADFGDGGYAVIDQNAADTTNVRMYHTYFNSLSAGLVGYATVATIATASDGNWGFRGCNGVTGNGINCNDTAVRFYAPLVSGPGNPNPIYFGTDRLYRSTDNGTTHTVVSQAPLVSGQAITAIGIASNDDNVRAVGLANGKVYRTTNGSSTLTDVTGTIPARFVSRIVVDPNDNNIAYVTLAAYTATGTITTGQNVWKTTNFLAGTPTWAVSGSGIPDVPVNAFAIDPTNSATLYAGTDIGVYYSTNSGTSWTVLSTGLPRVPVFDLKFQGASSLRLLRAATHGRGIWELKVGCPTVTMSPSTLPNGASNTMYSQQLSASGDVGPYTFAQTGGTLPPGLMLSSSGLLSGTPTTSGSYTFTVTATSSDTCPGSQMYTVVIDCPTANAGPDQNLCNVNAATMAGNTPSSGSGAWSQISGPNTATITTASLPTTTMTGLIAGTYAFRWMISSGTCTASTDDVAVTIAPLPTAANAGSDQTLCTTSAATLAANSPASGTGAWSVVSGPSTLAAQFSSTSANNATFTPVGGAGTYTLRWTISNATCTASTDDVALNYSAPPTAANAGPDQNLCITSAATLAANNPSVGTGVWSVVSGPSTLTAQFSSTSARNATFTPAGGAGTYTLRWTISSSPCTVATDDVVLNYSAQPTTANAGPDQTLCGTTPPTLAANAPGVGTGAWSVVSGPSTLTSQFSNTGANNATFAPAGGSGNYTLRWTITNGACTSTDDVTLNYNAAPLVTTNPTNQSVAPGGTATFTVAASGIPTPTVQWQVSTDMGATFTNIPGATNTTLSFPVTGADNGKKYRAVFTNSCNPPATTTAAMLTTGTTPPLIVQAGGRPNNVGVNIGDPAVCIDPAGIVGIEAMLTNTGNTPQISSFTATLPAGLTAIAGTCFATSINPGVCTIAGNGGSVSWNGQLNAGETLSVVYRARIGATVAQGTQFCIGNAGTVGGIPANLQYCFTISCPLTDTRVSDQKAGSVVVFPYYASTIGGASDTRLTLSNISNSAGTTNVHLFFIDGISCQPADVFLCLTPNASFSFKASDYDPGNTGYLIAVVVNAQGVPIQNNVLIGNAFVNTPTFLDNYGAESFWANSPAVATVDGTNATLYFDQVGYDAVPKQFTVEIQSPLDAIGQQVITAALNGNLITSQMSGAAQVGTGLAFNEKEVFTSFSAWLAGTCQARGIISTNSPRVPNGLGNLIKTGQAGTLKFNVGAAVGLLMTPRTATWKGIRTLHKTQTGATTLIIPIFAPVC